MVYMFIVKNIVENIVKLKIIIKKLLYFNNKYENIITNMK